VLVIDADAISDIDYTGIKGLRALIDELNRAHVVVGVARAVGGAPQNLRRSGLLDRLGGGRFFSTVDEAVTALHPGPTPDTGTTAGPSPLPGPGA